MDGYEKIEIAGNQIFVPPPVVIPDEPFVGRKDLIDKTLAAWSSVDGTRPLHFRLYGPPGTGKNALVYELARILGKDLYIIDGNDDLRVEDIACIPAIDRQNTNRLYYVASPLFAAMLRGESIAFFDEIAKAPPGALSALASVLDQRMTLTSTMAAIRIKASEGFLFCAALNEDEETGIGLPEYIQERTSPAIYVGTPSMSELSTIVKSRLRGNPDIWIEGFVSLFKHSNLSPRSAINMLGSAIKLYKYSKSKNEPSELTIPEVHKFVIKAAEGFPVEISEQESPSNQQSDPERMRRQNVYTMLPQDKRGSIH